MCATGTQFVIRRGEARAVVVELAAGLRLFEREGVQLTETYPDSSLPPGGAGITLAPWANRIEGGKWALNGKTQQLDITEVSLGNASHGLLRNTGYRALSQAEDQVVLEAWIFPQHGYPFLLSHTVRYAITEDLGLAVKQMLTNHSSERAPFVLGAHPYLRLGDTDTTELTLTVRAGSYLPANERKIPGAPLPVDEEYDLSAGRVIDSTLLDSAYTGLAFDDGVARHRLSAPDGRAVSLWSDESCQYVHVFVTDNLPGRARAVAIEPMTGPANAFNSGEGLRWLDPGESFSARWGIDAELG